jgi:hypothetical protein
MPKRPFLLSILCLALAGCAALAGHDPVRVQLAGLQPLPGEGLEWRMLLKLRVQNPNDVAVDYDGAAVELLLRGQAFATGVSSERGSVPRYGEAVLTIPVTVSALGVVRQVVDLVGGREAGPLDYALRGKLGGTALGGTPLGAVRFESSGRLAWPGAQP